MRIKKLSKRYQKQRTRFVPKGLAVVDDGDHVLDVALRKLAILQMLLFVSYGLIPVPETRNDTEVPLKVYERAWNGNSAASPGSDLTRKEFICFRQSIRTCSLNVSSIWAATCRFCSNIWRGGQKDKRKDTGEIWTGWSSWKVSYGVCVYLEDDGRQGGLVVAVLVRLGLRLLLPVFLVCFQSFPQPACNVRLLQEDETCISRKPSSNNNTFLHQM